MLLIILRVDIWCRADIIFKFVNTYRADAFAASAAFWGSFTCFAYHLMLSFTALLLFDLIGCLFWLFDVHHILAEYLLLDWRHECVRRGRFVSTSWFARARSGIFLAKKIRAFYFVFRYHADWILDTSWRPSRHYYASGIQDAFIVTMQHIDDFVMRRAHAFCASVLFAQLRAILRDVDFSEFCRRCLAI